MVKVTFNSALAQKEAKKDESKCGEEALIIPPDAVAVDCKVRGPGRSGEWALGPAGRAARGRRRLCALRRLRARARVPGRAGLSFWGCCSFLSGRSFSFVRKCVCRIGGLGGLERGIEELCRIHGPCAVGGMCVGSGLGSFHLETGGDVQNNKNNNRVWHFLPV